MRYRSETAPVAPEGDLLIVFDNNQYIGKNYRVKHTGKQPGNLHTAFICTTIPLPERLQTSISNDDLLRMVPQAYSLAGLTAAIKADPIALHRMDDASESFLENQWSNFFTHEPKMRNIIKARRGAPNRVALRTCPACIDANQDKRIKTRRICDGCTTKINEAKHTEAQVLQTVDYKLRNDIVHDTGRSSNEKADIRVLDPVYVNPGSKAGTKKCLDHIKRQADIKHTDPDTQQEVGTRAFVYVLCDGDPFSKILSSFWGKPEYSWMVPLIGIGHVQHNIMRYIIRTYWNVVFSKAVSAELCHKTAKSLKYAYNANDFHKTRQILYIVRCAMMREICRGTFTIAALSLVVSRWLG